jgi:hypothetical protein
MTAKSFDEEKDTMHSPALAQHRAVKSASALAVIVLAALGVASSAGASTLYACVNKRTGAARLFSYKPRCKRGQERLSWNTVGPAGKNGANGKNGATGKAGPTGKTGNPGSSGTNGAVAGYSASQPASVEFTGKKEAARVTVLTKTVNAGNYLVFAKTVVSASASSPTRAAGVCELLEGTSTIDTSGWDTELAPVISGSDISEEPLSLEAAVSLKATTALSLVCSDLSPDEDGLKIGAAFSQLLAVQTNQNS